MPSTIVFLYANDPNPGLLERMKTLHSSGRYEVHAIYWHRQRSNITFPFSTAIPQDRFHPIVLPDPRGSGLRRVVLTLRFLWMVRRLLRRIRPDGLHVVNADMLGVARLVLLADPRRAALVYDMQDQMGDALPWRYRWLYRWLLRRADAVLLRSDGFTHYVEKNALVRSSTPVHYVANAPAGWTLIHRPRLDRRELVVGYFGNIRGAQLVQALVDAVTKVQRSGRDVRILFAGVGPEAARVARLADELDYVEYHGPYDYATEYASLHDRADLMYALYPQETPNYRTHIARRFHESILSGLPIVVTRDTQMGKIVREYGGGWEVRDGSVDELVQLLSHIYDDRSELTRASADEGLKQRHRFETYEPLLLQTHDQALASRGVGATPS